jgi:hypothetical protein
MNAYSLNMLNELKPSPVAANLTRIKKNRNSCLLLCLARPESSKTIMCYCPFKGLRCKEKLLINMYLQNNSSPIKRVTATTNGMNFYIFVRLGDAGWSILHAAYHLQSYHYWSPLCILGVRIFLLNHKNEFFTCF